MQTKAQYRSFTTWLRAQRGRNDVVGGLARDVAQDKHWPTRAWTLPRLMSHLKGYGACPGAIGALQQAWAEFHAAR